MSDWDAIWLNHKGNKKGYFAKQKTIGGFSPWIPDKFCHLKIGCFDRLCAISLMLHRPHFVTIMLRNIKNQSIHYYPNKPIVFRVPYFFQLLPLSQFGVKL